MLFLLNQQVGVRGSDVVVLGVEKKSVAKLQEERTVRKICLLDDHVVMAFAGNYTNLLVLVHTNFMSKKEKVKVGTWNYAESTMHFVCCSITLF